MSRFLIFIFFLLTFSLRVNHSYAVELKVAVASNFNIAIKAIVKEYDKQSKDHINLIFGSTGKHYAQIKNGAPYDIFLAADEKRPLLLEKENLALPNTRFTYAIGKIVLWSPKERFVDRDGKVLQKKQFKHLAIANPKLAPYGRAAQEILISRNLWGSLKARLVQGENVNQAFQFVTSGNADLGFVALSQVKSLKQSPKGSWWNVPQHLYKPIGQQAILLKDSKAAREFIKFLKSNKGVEIIKSYGYETP